MDLEWSGVDLEWSGVDLEWSGVDLEWSGVEWTWSGVEWSGVDLEWSASAALKGCNIAHCMTYTSTDIPSESLKVMHESHTKITKLTQIELPLSQSRVSPSQSKTMAQEHGAVHTVQDSNFVPLRCSLT